MLHVLCPQRQFSTAAFYFFPCPVQLRAFLENQQYSGNAVICSCRICLIATENVYLIGQKSLHSETSSSIRSLVFPKFWLVSMILFGPPDRLCNFVTFVTFFSQNTIPVFLLKFHISFNVLLGNLVFNLVAISE